MCRRGPSGQLSQALPRGQRCRGTASSHPARSRLRNQLACQYLLVPSTHSERLACPFSLALLQLFQGAAQHVAPPPDAPPSSDPTARLLLALVDLWLDKFDCIGQPAARKLSALALCVLLTAPLPALLERLELVVTHITSVWFEVRARQGGVGWQTRGCVCAPPAA